MTDKYNELILLATKLYDSCDNDEEREKYAEVNKFLSEHQSVLEISFLEAMALLELLKIPNEKKVEYYLDLINNKEYTNYINNKR